MSAFIPPELQFDIRPLVPQLRPPNLRKKRGPLFSWTTDNRIPMPSVLSGAGRLPRCDVDLGWNPEGLAIRVIWKDKVAPVTGRGSKPEDSDHVVIWLDLRPSGDVHRASEWCHCLRCLPVDEESEGKPSIESVPIPQQRAAKGECNPARLTAKTEMTSDGCAFELWIPGSQLYGWRGIDELRRIGFSCAVHDSESDTTPSGLGGDFPVSWDPSLWMTVELCDTL